MLYTLADARKFVNKYVEAGKCPNKQVVIDRVNEAQRRLIPKLDPTFMHRRIRFYAENNTITLPREVEKVLSVDIDKNPRRTFGMSYEFLENGPGDLCVGEGYKQDLMDLGNHWPIFFDVPGDSPRNIIALSTEQEDYGKEILLQGRNSLSEEICTDGVPGETITVGQWIGGVEGSLTEELARSIMSDTEFKEISYVKKPVTKGHICLYTWKEYDADAEDHPIYFLAKYHPDETQPNYRRYRIKSPCCNSDTPTNVLCDVKLRHVELKHDDDLLLIQNLDALKAMVIAIREENAMSFEAAVAYEGKAERMLQEQLKNEVTHDNVLQVQADEFGIGSIPNII